MATLGLVFFKIGGTSYKVDGLTYAKTDSGKIMLLAVGAITSADGKRAILTDAIKREMIRSLQRAA